MNEPTNDYTVYFRWVIAAVMITIVSCLSACHTDAPALSQHSAPNASGHNLSGLNTSSYPWTVGSRDRANQWYDAVELAQGSSKDGELDRERVVEIHQALSGISGRHFPAWLDRPVHTRRFPETNAIYLSTTNRQRGKLMSNARETDKDWREFVNGLTGIKELDELVKQCRGRIGFGMKDGSTLMVHFGRMVDVIVMSRRFTELEGIDAWPNIYTSDGDYVKLEERGDRWHFTFSKGWGDRPGGCINREFYFATWDRNLKRPIAAGYLADAEMRNKRELGQEWRDSLLWAWVDGIKPHTDDENTRAVRTLDDIEAALQTDLPWLNTRMVKALHYGLHVDRYLYYPDNRFKQTIRADAERARRLLKTTAEKHPDAELRRLAKSLMEGKTPE